MCPISPQNYTSFISQWIALSSTQVPKPETCHSLCLGFLYLLPAMIIMSFFLKLRSSSSIIQLGLGPKWWASLLLQRQANGWRVFEKWYYNAAGFNKLGLMWDDSTYENDDVKESIRRLPENLYNNRVFCVKRALDLTMRQQILPKEQWTKYEEDKFYLEPYLKEVIRERKEREESAKK